MRLLIYGMQSSGASTLAFTLAQKPNCAALVDIWTMYAAPAVSGPGDLVAKVVVTTAFPLALHQDRFQPDRTILVLRHPVANYRSLATKSYRHHCGFMEEKFLILDELFGHGSGFDTIVHYEDLVFDPEQTLAAISAIGWSCDPEFLKLRRSHPEMVAVNEARYPSLTERLQYGPGQHRGGRLTTEYTDLTDLSSASPVADWCPRIIAHYDEFISQRQPKWQEQLPILR